MPTAIKLIAGLGNPGPDYDRTRHNAGFWFVDRIAEEFNESFSTDTKLHCDSLRIRRDGIDCRLIKPQTYMNESGRSLQAVMSYYKVEPQETLVVYDEIDLPPGTAHLKFDGGHGGHNGMRDILQAIGTKAFYRLRIGVGHPGNKDQVISYVLGRPGKEEEALINQAINQVLESLPLLLEGEMHKAMTSINRNKKMPPATDTD